jgi:hypothetical protein
LNKDRPKGLGIQPDILMMPQSEAIKKGYDLKLQTIRKLILAENKLAVNKSDEKKINQE